MNSPLPFADGGPRIIANGYEPLAVELSEIALGHLHPTGPYAFGQDVRTIRAEGYATGVLPAKIPLDGTDSNAARARWCAGVRIEASDEGVAAAVESLVRKIAGAGLVQLSERSPSRLIPFRIEHTDARQFAMQTHRWDAGGVKVEATGVCWLLEGAGLYWRDGVSLLDVKRADLPLLTVEAAREIIEASDDGFAKLQPAPAPTERDLRVQARVAHRLSCGTCASCQDAQPGDWVALHDLSWPACRIVSVDGEEFVITGPDGKQYRAPGHRLFPTAAPVVPEPQRVGTELIVGGGFYRTVVDA